MISKKTAWYIRNNLIHSKSAVQKTRDSFPDGNHLWFLFYFCLLSCGLICSRCCCSGRSLCCHILSAYIALLSIDINFDPLTILTDTCTGKLIAYLGALDDICLVCRHAVCTDICLIICIIGGILLYDLHAACRL